MTLASLPHSQGEEESRAASGIPKENIHWPKSHGMLEYMPIQGPVGGHQDHSPWRPYIVMSIAPAPKSPWHKTDADRRLQPSHRRSLSPALSRVGCPRPQDLATSSCSLPQLGASPFPLSFLSPLDTFWCRRLTSTLFSRFS